MLTAISAFVSFSGPLAGVYYYVDLYFEDQQKEVEEKELMGG